jgi:hypothetical protein
MATRKKSSSTSRSTAKSSPRRASVRQVRRRAKPEEETPDESEVEAAADEDVDATTDAVVGTARERERASPAEVRPRPRAATLADAPRPVAAPPAPAAPAAPRTAGTRPFVVARGEDAIRVFSETLKHSGFFETIENAQVKSGKRRELFEVACKVDFMRAVRPENDPVSYVDPKLVAHLFNQLLDRGFRILRVVETKNELSRYLTNRSVKSVGKAIGYDESCYELKDLADDLVPLDLGPAVGRRATGRVWRQADFRIVFAKNRTDELFGPALVLWNVFHTLATPTDLVALEYGVDAGDFALAMLEKVPVHFSLIDAIHARDGSPGNVFPYEVLRNGDGSAAPVEGAQVHRLGTVIAGAEALAVEAAGQKMQGLDPLADPIALKKLRKVTGWKAPAEVDGLPTFPGWKGIGTRIRDTLGTEKPAENTRLSVLATLSQADLRLFPPHASGYQAIRLRQRVGSAMDELRRRFGAPPSAVAGPNDEPRASAPPNATSTAGGDFDGEDDGGDGEPGDDPRPF